MDSAPNVRKRHQRQMCVKSWLQKDILGYARKTVLTAFLCHMQIKLFSGSRLIRIWNVRRTERWMYAK